MDAIGSLKRVFERAGNLVALKYVAGVVGTFFKQTEKSRRGRRLVADNPVPDHAGTRNVSLKDHAIESIPGIGAGQSNRVAGDGKIYELPNPADNQTIRLGMNDLVTPDHDVAVAQAVDIETVHIVDSVVVVEIHIRYLPATIGNVMTDDPVKANFCRCIGDRDGSALPGSPMIHRDVFHDIAATFRWAVGIGVDFDGKGLCRFSRGIHDVNVVDPMLSQVRSQADRL